MSVELWGGAVVGLCVGLALGVAVGEIAERKRVEALKKKK